MGLQGVVTPATEDQSEAQTRPQGELEVTKLQMSLIIISWISIYCVSLIFLSFISQQS